jgi:hypothetical protein
MFCFVMHDSQALLISPHRCPRSRDSFKGARFLVVAVESASLLQACKYQSPNKPCIPFNIKHHAWNSSTPIHRANKTFFGIGANAALFTWSIINLPNSNSESPGDSILDQKSQRAAKILLALRYRSSLPHPTPTHILEGCPVSKVQDCPVRLNIRSSGKGVRLSAKAVG